jgi:complement component 1 Q subcomponent-binding protein
MLSKVFTSALKPAFNQVFKNKQVTSTFFRAMASSEVARIDKGKVKLTKAITREIKFEEENYTNDESVQKFLDSNNFTLRDTIEDNTVELTKKVGNVTVQVTFQSRPPQFNEEGEEEEGEGNIQKGEGEEDQQFDDQNFADFTVYVIQTNGKALTFECTSFDSEINVNFVSVVTDVAAHKDSSRLERVNGYSADFSILDERLQTGFLEYLKGFGINEDVALFVEHFSQDKDQRQYMQWLKDVNAFIEKPLD